MKEDRNNYNEKYILIFISGILFFIFLVFIVYQAVNHDSRPYNERNPTKKIISEIKLEKVKLRYIKYCGYLDNAMIILKNRITASIGKDGTCNHMPKCAPWQGEFCQRAMFVVAHKDPDKTYHNYEKLAKLYQEHDQNELQTPYSVIYIDEKEKGDKK